MKPLAAPGLDGMSAVSYQKYWNVVHKDISKMALDVLNGDVSPSSLNETYICLISLCNVTYKIISKAIANRLRGIIHFIVGECQSAFVPKCVLC